MKAAGQKNAAKPAIKKKNTDMRINFNSTPYVFRWQQKGQYEFTPDSQTDLRRYSDMLTINLHMKTQSGEDLAALANTIVPGYEAAGGTVLKTDSKPRTADHEAEHLVAVAFIKPDFSEVSISRFLIFEKTGLVIVASHREYGAKSQQLVMDWIKKYAGTVEKNLMNWSAIPKIAVLKTLPESL